MRFGVCRRGSTKIVWLVVFSAVFLLYFYYLYVSTNQKAFDDELNVDNIDDTGEEELQNSRGKLPTSTIVPITRPVRKKVMNDIEESSIQVEKALHEKDDKISQKPIKSIRNVGCQSFTESRADINTREIYSNFNFNPNWMSKRSIWKDELEERYTRLMNDSSRPPLHVFIQPHSHNDPGWKSTFEEYFTYSTKRILDTLVQKLPQLSNMTFIWTEICFLHMWWESADEEQKETFKQLVDDGRIEITTGGWVMTDEAIAHVYAQVDQLIEGNQWVKHTLNVTPTHSWSIDPFGHGSTMPYILANSGFDGAIIQRIHYNWKEFLAEHQSGDFMWKPLWNNDKHSLLVHNMPFDLYFVEDACGPHRDVCRKMDFRWFFYNFDDETLRTFADELMGEYSRSASLFPHNVFFSLVGGDFRYDIEYEFDVQYSYMRIAEFVNSHPERYNNAKLQFGTPKDYFNLVRERSKNFFPSLVGDFFPYGDVFTSGKPQYWTGYFTTRPYIKIISRELEHELRNAEILFTLAYNLMRQKHARVLDEFTENYKKIVTARRNLGLLQHHDALTGTSKAAVMKNYLDRSFKSVIDTVEVQQEAVNYFLQPEASKRVKNLNVTSEFIRISSTQRAEKIVINNSYIVLFNSLAQERVELVSVRVSSYRITVLDEHNNSVPYQVNNILSERGAKAQDGFEVIFVAKLQALSLATYRIIYDESVKSHVLASFEEIKPNASEKFFIVEGSKMKVSIDTEDGFIKYVEFKNAFLTLNLDVSFGAYNTSVGYSGAYLFQPDRHKPERDIFENDKMKKIIVIKGKIASYVTVIYGSLLRHTVRILNTQTHLDNGIFIINDIEMSEKHENAEMFMRILTPVVQNSGNEPEFFTDLNNFQWQKRKIVSSIGVEGNYYPITSSIFVQDNDMRATLITNHAQGATSPSEGVIEVMLDRRTPVDDNRGMEEGVSDNLQNQQKYWLTFENLIDNDERIYQVPSLHVHHLINALNYPVNLYKINSEKIEINRQVNLLNNPLPCDLHLFNLRALTDDFDKLFPSSSALLIVRKLNFDCQLFKREDPFYIESCQSNNFDDIDIFNKVRVDFAQSLSLTGNKNYGFIASFSEIPIEPMDLKTFNITFG